MAVFNIESKYPCTLSEYINRTFSPIEKDIFSKLSETLGSEDNLKLAWLGLDVDMKPAEILDYQTRRVSSELVDKGLVNPIHVSEYLCGGSLPPVKDEVTDWGFIFEKLLEQSILSKVVSGLLSGVTFSIFNKVLGTNIVSSYKKELARALMAVYLQNM